ncbi:helix-turn-helix transcriptional regulator [Plantactinospora sp. B6F1]|uniref:helix-turn-helix transcriptional regulator n=1 Tax=Plantactinospora sp. B6F1 TaxID=3158971 RepID=UPI0010D42926
MVELTGRARREHAAERIVRWLRTPRGRRAVRVTAVLTGCYVWAMVIVGFSFALVERGARHWWLILPFGLLVPLIALAAVRAVPAAPGPGAEADEPGVEAVRPPAGTGPAARSRSDARPPQPDGTGSARPAGPETGTAAAGLPLEPLSGRELQVLAQLAAGRSNREIANALYVAQGTVKAHLNHIFRKLGAASRLQAVTHAHQAGLLDRVRDEK